MQELKVQLKGKSTWHYLKKGQIGFINGYVHNSDGITYAIVVVGEKIDTVPINNLKIIQE